MSKEQPLKSFRLKSLKGWQIVWRSLKDRIGMCDPDAKTIYLDPELAHDGELLTYTYGHEGSHAIDDILSEMRADLVGAYTQEMRARFRDLMED